MSPWMHELVGIQRIEMLKQGNTPCRTHEVVEISLAQMDSLCGNALELRDVRGVPIMAMSTQVRDSEGCISK